MGGCVVLFSGSGHISGVLQNLAEIREWFHDGSDNFWFWTRVSWQR